MSLSWEVLSSSVSALGTVAIVGVSLLAVEWVLANKLTHEDLSATPRRFWRWSLVGPSIVVVGYCLSSTDISLDVAFSVALAGVVVGLTLTVRRGIRDRRNS